MYSRPQQPTGLNTPNPAPFFLAPGPGLVNLAAPGASVSPGASSDERAMQRRGRRKSLFAKRPDCLFSGLGSGAGGLHVLQRMYVPTCTPASVLSLLCGLHEGQALRL